jgi:hypothetical protein
MKNNEFMRIKYKYFPEAIRKQHNLDRFVSSDDCIYIRIKKGMCGLKQAAILACKHLVNQLAPCGCHPCPCTTGLWQHETRPTKSAAKPPSTCTASMDPTSAWSKASTCTD